MSSHGNDGGSTYDSGGSRGDGHSSAEGNSSGLGGSMVEEWWSNGGRSG